jgi:hypothetical protein
MKKQHVYSQTPIAIRQRKCWERSRKLIDLRVCVTCRYGFVSRFGYNICSVCLSGVKREFIRQNPHYICKQFRVIRGWAMRQMGYMPFKWTINPRIPFPMSSRAQPGIKRAFEGLRRVVEEKNIHLFDSMPRIEGVGPFYDLQPQLTRGGVIRARV